MVALLTSAPISCGLFFFFGKGRCHFNTWSTHLNLNLLALIFIKETILQIVLMIMKRQVAIIVLGDTVEEIC